MSETETEVRYPVTFSHRTYKAGGVLLMIAGVIGSIIGLALLFGASVFGGTLTALGVTSLAAIIGVVMLVFSVIEFGGGYVAYEGKSWYASIVGAVLGMVAIVTLPLTMVGMVLIALGEGQFEDSPTATTVDQYTERPAGSPSGSPSGSDD